MGTNSKGERVVEQLKHLERPDMAEVPVPIRIISTLRKLPRMAPRQKRDRKTNAEDISITR